MFWKFWQRKKKFKVGSPEWLEEVSKFIAEEEAKGNMVSDEVAAERLEKMFGKIINPENNSLDT